MSNSKIPMLYDLLWRWERDHVIGSCGCYMPAAEHHYWIYLTNPLGFSVFCLLLFCSPFYLQYIKGVQESRKQQSILSTALNECRPSRKCLVLSQNRHSCGQHPCSLSVVTFSNAILFTFRTTPSLASW